MTVQYAVRSRLNPAVEAPRQRANYDKFQRGAIVFRSAEMREFQRHQIN
jgi:hypothetical protein